MEKEKNNETITEQKQETPETKPVDSTNQEKKEPDNNTSNIEENNKKAEKIENIKEEKQEEKTVTTELDKKENNSEQNKLDTLSDDKKANNENKTEEQKKPKKGKNFVLDDYVCMMLIGSGNFSEIYMVEHKITKILYAMKSFSKMRVEQLHKQEDVLMEKHVMEKITPHENIIGYYGSSKDDLSMYILYEYINGGDLWKRCVVYGMGCEERIKYYFIQLLQGIKHMHSFNVPHRDIKPENILVTKDEKLLKIIDFGSSYDLDGTEFSKKFDEERQKIKNKKPFYKHFVGTPNFMAPECVHNQFSDKRSDYWSLGCVLYNMFTGFPPFLGASEYLIFQKSIEQKYIFPPGIIPPLAEDLIRKCIIIDPDKRLNIDQMLEHPFLKEMANSDIIKQKIVPEMTEEEKEFYKIRTTLYGKYNKYKKHAGDLETIQRHEEMEEDLKRNEITPEPTENDKEMKELVGKKSEIKEEFEKKKEEFKRDIDSYRRDESVESNKQFNMKIDFLETQIKHDIFNIIYRGAE